MSSLLSIVVPTKDRYEYLKKLVDLVVSFQSEEIELVIQDNSEDNSIFTEFISEKINKHPWVKYFYDDQYLTTIQNFDRAVNNCTGDYICFIGDDDGVVRNITRYVRWMKENNIEALRSAHSVYTWPRNCKYSSYLSYEGKGKGIKYLSPVHELFNILNNGCLNLGRIPVLYTGIVQKKILDKIYLDYGTYFPGVSPDIANGVVLCFYVNKYVYVDTPIVITGTSRMTGGGFQGKLVSFSEVKFLEKKDLELWPSYIPSFWNSRLVWPSSALMTLKRIEKESFIKYFDIDKAMVYFYRENRKYRNIASSYANNRMRFELLNTCVAVKRLFEDIIDKSLRIISNNKRFINGLTYFGLDSIEKGEIVLHMIDSINNINLDEENN